MTDWTHRLTLLWPLLATEPVAVMDALAAAIADESGEDTVDERAMFEKSPRVSEDFGASETHVGIHMSVTAELVDAFASILDSAMLPGILWYIERDGTLERTNDTSRTVGQPLHWRPGLAVNVGQRYRFGGRMYACIQGHTTQADWTPPRAPALWRAYISPNSLPTWRQPTGAHDAYPAGARVTHNGDTWVSVTGANTGEPGVSGWQRVGSGGQPAAWVQPSGAHDAYSLGARVTHNGATWESTVAANVWEPGVFGWVQV